MARRIIGTATVQVKADTTGFASGLNGAVSGLSGAFRKLSGAIAAIGLGHIAKEAIEFGATYRVQLDNARAAVDGLTDSTAEADKLMREMTAFAIATPFDLPGVQNATTKLLAYGEGFGITTDNVIEYVQIIGDAAAATGKGTDAMNNVITVLGKISGQGRVMTRDMNQLTANFPSLHPWEILAEVTGKTEAELRKLAAAPGGLSGVVDSTEFINALVEGMQEIPGAAGAMERRMNTLGGSIELFKDTMGVALAEGLQPFFKAIQGLLKSADFETALSGLIAVFSELATVLVTSLAPVMPTLIDAFTGIVAALLPAAPAVANLVSIFAMMLVSITPLIETVALFVTWITNMLMALDPALLGAIAAGVLLLWLSFTGGAFALLPIVIALVIAVATLIRNNWDTITRITGQMVDKIVAAWQWLYDNVIGPVSDFVSAVIDFFQNLYDVLVGHSIIPDMVNAIIGWFNVLKNFVMAIFNALKGAVLAVWNGIKTGVITVVNGIRTVVTTVFNALKSTVSAIWNAIKSTATTVWNAIKTAVTTPINAAKSIATTAIQGIRNVVSSAWSGLSGIVSGIWNGIKNAIIGPMRSAYSVVSGIVSSIRNLVSSAISAASSAIHAGGNFNPLNWGAEGGVFTRPTIMGIGEAGPEALIPLSNPMRAMQLMQQSGLDKLASSMGGRSFDGPLVSMPGAIIQDATDADLVAQRTLVAMQAAMVA